jgi:hypothetical protein
MKSRFHLFDSARDQFLEDFRRAEYFAFLNLNDVNMADAAAQRQIFFLTTTNPKKTSPFSSLITGEKGIAYFSRSLREKRCPLSAGSIET